jgi:hypothetical protein
LGGVAEHPDGAMRGGSLFMTGIYVGTNVRDNEDRNKDGASPDVGFRGVRTLKEEHHDQGP